MERKAGRMFRSAVGVGCRQSYINPSAATVPLSGYLSQVLDQVSSTPVFSGGVTFVPDKDAGFTATLFSETISKLPSFSGTLIRSKMARFYAGASTTVRIALLELQASQKDTLWDFRVLSYSNEYLIAGENGEGIILVLL
jgi:hypothetical protein